MKLHFVLPDGGLLHGGQGQAVLVLDQLVLPAGPHQHRVFVPGVGALHLPGGQVQDPQPDRHEHFRVVAVAEGLVDLLHHFCKTDTAPGVVFDGGFRPHHEHGGRYALAADVGDHQAELVPAHVEKVVKVSAHRFGRGHQGVELHALGGELEVFRKRGVLNVGRQLELVPHVLLGRVDVFSQGEDGGVDVVAQLGEFLAAVDPDQFV